MFDILLEYSQKSRLQCTQHTPTAEVRFPIGQDFLEILPSFLYTLLSKILYLYCYWLIAICYIVFMTIPRILLNRA